MEMGRSRLCLLNKHDQKKATSTLTTTTPNTQKQQIRGTPNWISFSLPLLFLFMLGSFPSRLRPFEAFEFYLSSAQDLQPTGNQITSIHLMQWFGGDRMLDWWWWEAQRHRGPKRMKQVDVASLHHEIFNGPDLKLFHEQLTYIYIMIHTHAHTK